MLLLTANQISKRFGVDTVLENVSFALNSNQKLGIVGSNGAGKTTLLRILTGETDHDSGSIYLSPQLKLGYLRQEDELFAGTTVWQAMESVFSDLFEMERRLREIEYRMGEVHDSNPDEYGKLTDEYATLTIRFEDGGGYDWKSRIIGVLKGLGLPDDCYERTIRQLSGGQRSRLSLARLLLEKPDILLLDEPTNHLDIDAVSWLETYLQAWQGAVIVVSHDRWFLDAVCDSIGEISFGNFTLYQGNFTRYLALREEQYRLRMKEYQANQKEIKRQQAIINRLRVWGREKSIKTAKSWEKKLDKLERVDKPKSAHTMHLDLASKQRSGNDILITDGLTMAFGEHVLFHDLNMHIKTGERVALMGPNGIGKTTFLRIIARQLHPAAGSFMLGTNVEPAYYDQQQADLSHDKTVMDEVWDEFPQMEPQEVRDRLASFLFTGDDVFKLVGELSGGEKGRLSLLKLMLQQGNLLLLDEPTNHLDMDSCQVLEESLTDFPGTIIFVSHDRYFINNIATRIIEMTHDGIEQYPGNWSQYLYHKAQGKKEEVIVPDKTKTQLEKERRRDRDLQQKRKQERLQITALENEITDLEALIAQLEVALGQAQNYTSAEISDISHRYGQLQQELTDKMERWEYLLDQFSDT